MHNIYHYLEKHRITYQLEEHPSVFTCEDAEQVASTLPGVQTKNLFVRDKKKTTYVLVIIDHHTKVDLKALAKQLNLSRFSFGSPEMLQELLGVTPGSASVLGLVYDAEHQVQVVIDQVVWDAEYIQCHPLVNTASVAISHAGLEVFLRSTGHKVQVLGVPSVS